MTKLHGVEAAGLTAAAADKILAAIKKTSTRARLHMSTSGCALIGV
jgi:hypothetical protein